MPGLPVERKEIFAVSFLMIPKDLGWVAFVHKDH